MKLTKYEHACFVVEKDNKSIVVDLGNLTTDFVEPDEVVAIVITHLHPDHFDIEPVKALAKAHPRTIVIGPSEVTTQLPDLETRAVQPGDNFTIEGIELEFFGGEHNPIHPSRPVAQNVGVLIEERVYYPGDSFAIPERSVDTLALPVGAPWLKISEAVDFLLAVSPRFAFPTHDAGLSTAGQGFVDRTASSFAEEADIKYERIDGTTIEID